MSFGNTDFLTTLRSVRAGNEARTTFLIESRGNPSGGIDPNPLELDGDNFVTARPRKREVVLDRGGELLIISSSVNMTIGGAMGREAETSGTREVVVLLHKTILPQFRTHLARGIKILLDDRICGYLETSGFDISESMSRFIRILSNSDQLDLCPCG